MDEKIQVTHEDTIATVVLDREGRLRLDDQPVHPDLLAQRMKALVSGSPGETVFLRADKLIPYGEVLHVMDLIRKAGVMGIVLAGGVVSVIALVTVPMGTSPGPAR